MTDPLAEIRDVWEHAKHRNEEGKYASLPDTVVEDTLLVFAEIDRLRDLLGRLEWAGSGDFGNYCPACQGFKEEAGPFGSEPLDVGHDPDCWLAAELQCRDDR